MYENCVNRKRN